MYKFTYKKKGNITQNDDMSPRVILETQILILETFVIKRESHYLVCIFCCHFLDWDRV